MNSTEFEALLSKIQADRATVKEVETLGGISHKVVQSDKLGFDWDETYLGDKLITQVYTEQENPKGTEEAPIAYYEGCPLINNAFYLKEDGKKYVYMNGEWAAWDIEP